MISQYEFKRFDSYQHIMTELTLNLESVRASAEQACRLMKVLSNPDRLLLLCQLTEGEKCVSELEELVGISQPTLSQQLGVLRNEQIVNTRREGKNVYYQISSQQALAVMQVLYEQFCGPHKE
jgi:DNA-binding transcriptional ArsR family regulator|tara:strand:- start:12 stop:380 length:369 start_codon:yes stop_codon:yes gene_type:complete